MSVFIVNNDKNEKWLNVNDKLRLLDGEFWVLIPFLDLWGFKATILTTELQLQTYVILPQMWGRGLKMYSFKQVKKDFKYISQNQLIIDN